MAGVHGAGYREEHSSSLDARAELKLDPCTSCKERGHYCEAVSDADKPGERLCVFCADGVFPCAYEKMQQKSQTAQPGHWLPPSARKKSLRESTPPADAGGKEKTAMADKKCKCGCGGVLDEDQIAEGKEYLWGHKKNLGKRNGNAAPRKPKSSKSEYSNDLHSVQVSEAFLDEWWTKKSPEEKADVFSRQF